MMPNFDTYGFTRPGGPDYVPPPPPRCVYCGSFLPFIPDRQEHWENAITCDGTVDEWGLSDCGYRETAHDEHREVMYAGITRWTTCPKCKRVNEESD